MLLALASLVAIGYLPGALIYRLPVADRPRRAALPADERAFWAVVLSATITTLFALALASAGAYTFGRLLVADIALAALLIAAARGRLRYAPAAARPSWTIALPAAIIVLGAYLFFPSSEYVMGGKDPGTYMNEGIQIGQHGSLTIHDPALAALPEEFRPMFLSGAPEGISQGLHQGVRFMGFFVADRSRGEVMGQFPHAFPSWIAIAYGLDGLSGARRAVGAWAILGLLAVYFAGARFAGRAPAFAAALLVGINVATVWYSRYPNSEMMQQALLFAALLALARAYRDHDRFFAPVAAVLFGSLMFVRLDSLVVLGAVGASLLLLVADGTRLGWRFLLPLSALLATAAVYFAGPMRAYLAIPMMQAGGAPGLSAALAALVIAGLVIRRARDAAPARVEAWQRWAPRVLAVAVAAAAAYAYFLREPAGLLAAHDAYAFRTFGWYVGPIGLLAAVAGFAAVAWTRFWKDPVLLTVGALVSSFFFYKIRIVPEHFWLARRFLPVILPFACLMMAAGAFVAYRRRLGPSPLSVPVRARLRAAVVYLAPALAVLAYVGWTFASATRPILNHVEYAGLIPAVERLAGQFGDRDLVLVEPRYSSDTHVLATPLAYVYGRNVLVFSSPRPGGAEVGRFLSWAGRTYDRVFLLAEGGFDLASRSAGITPVRNERFSIPEYESARNAYPREIRQKKFNLNLYRLERVDQAPPVLDLDIGGFDDPWVLRMFARQEQDGVTYRWVRDRSFVGLRGVPASARALVVRAGDGGRPEAAGPADVKVFLNDRALGTITVRGGFSEYRLDLPPEVAADAAARQTPAVVRLESTTWSPKAFLGGSDDRPLGIMLDRIRVE
ncbi:MAG TPA: hypothetical protein VLN08_14865 [Vicinamibacterales bacterium]|nr:hypothetical protein [Vicinamibacterales bacterium]